MRLKRIAFTLVFLAAGCVLQAQTVTTTGGTTNYLAKFTGSTVIASSVAYDNGKLAIDNVIGEAFRATASGSNAVAIRFVNSGNTSYFGTEGSTAGGYFTGSLPYSTVIYSPSAPIQHIVNGASRLIIDTAGHVGVGTTSPAAQLDIELSSAPASGVTPIALQAVNTVTVGQTNNYPQNIVTSVYSGAATQTYVFGLINRAQNTGAGTVSNAYGTVSSVMNNNASGTIGNAYAFYAQKPVRTGPVTNSYAFYAEDPNSINYFAGNIGIGTLSPSQKVEVVGNIKLDVSNGNNGQVIFSDGTSQTTAWTGVLCGGDYAESVDVAGDRAHYEPGDVLEINDSNPDQFLKVSEPYSPAVAGVFSTRPGALGRRQTTPKKTDEIPLAIIGIVPVKVTAENGPIHPHDLLVSSSKPGFAMKGTDRNKMLGAVIGKAMGSLDSGTGVIEVLVTLQ